jgi:ABC-type Zn uptake system ZnuABC Zn-binding protein ZnuA
MGARRSGEDPPIVPTRRSVLEPLRITALALFTLILPLTAPARGAGPLPVVTTSTDLKALVEAVGGSTVQVESLAPPLHDPHAVEVKPGQLARLKAAALLVRIGLDHEPWLAKVLRTVNDPRFVPESAHYLDASRGIRLLQAETPRVRAERGVHVHGFGNTHYWLDPENARPMTSAILEALARLQPADRAGFEANRKRFLERLDEGLARWSQALAPRRGTRVVVVHETWPYFAERFGLVVVAALEPTPGVPPSPSYLATLTAKMREGGVRLLIAEPYSNASLVSQVAARSGARPVTLIPSVGGDPQAGDYLALFDLNIKRLTDALRASR